MPIKVTDPIRLQYLFLRRKERDHDIELINSILSELNQSQRQEVINTKELNEIIIKVTNIDKSDLYKLKNDLARLGLVVPLEIFDERTYTIKEKAIHSSGRARYWRITRRGFEIIKEGVSIETKASIIARTYLEIDLMNEWITQLLAYHEEEINYSLATNVLKSIVMYRLKYATSKYDIESLELLLSLCESKPSDIIRKTLTPLEIITKGDAIQVKKGRIRLINIHKYIVTERKVTTMEYLKSIANAYILYLKEKGLYETIISQDTAAWPVPLQEIIARIQNKNVKSLGLEEHIEYCKRISYIYSGLEYIYQPLAKDEDKHIITIRTNLLKKILKEA